MDMNNVETDGSFYPSATGFENMPTVMENSTLLSSKRRLLGARGHSKGQFSQNCQYSETNTNKVSEFISSMKNYLPDNKIVLKVNSKIESKEDVIRLTEEDIETFTKDYILQRDGEFPRTEDNIIRFKHFDDYLIRLFHQDKQEANNLEILLEKENK